MGESKEVQKWADPAMWQAKPHEDPQEPKVTLSWAPEDPLGVMAMINGQYTGKVYRRPSDVTDEERQAAWDAGAVSMLSETPMEWFQVSILFENVSRAFTHQLVRTRMATYAQESMRFAVKEDLNDAIKLPPSLSQFADPAVVQVLDDRLRQWDEEGIEYQYTDDERKFMVWRNAVETVGDAYGGLVEMGMPAEDARGLLPTNTLTRIHMRTDIKTLIHLAGLRLCTQAQFEWRAVFAKLAQAFQRYGDDLQSDIDADWSHKTTYENRPRVAWQFDMIAGQFRPICYKANRCTMKSKADRYCAIRERVDAFEREGIPSSEWGWEHIGRDGIRIDPIAPVEWLANPRAAIPKEW